MPQRHITGYMPELWYTPLNAGDYLTPGIKILICAISIQSDTIRTFLTYDEKTGRFLIIDTTDDSLHWNKALHFESYTNALVEFAKRVDEEAIRFDRGEL